MRWTFLFDRIQWPVTCWGLWASVFWLLVTGCQPIAAPAQPTPLPTAPAQSVVDLPPAAADAAAARYDTVAFVRAEVLYIQTVGAAPLPIEDCTGIDCRTTHLKWSPEGEHLLYYWGPVNEVYGESPAQIRLADRNGQVQTVAEQIPYLRPPAWSPDGRHFAYLVATDRYQAPPDSANRIMEVWTADVSVGGHVQNPRLRGEIGYNEGCGGGGWSESADAYEGEGGSLYLGLFAAILEWTADDILLFSKNCFALGVGRFDMAEGRELAPYAGALHSLALNATKTAWVALDEQNRMVLGTPSSLAYAPVATQAQPELVFFGQITGDLYYTTLTEMSRGQLEDAVAQIQPAVTVSPYFEFTQPGLRAIQLPSLAEKVLWEGDGYAYARVTEGLDGTLFFARVEDNTELYAAIHHGQLTAANLNELLPHVDVLWLLPGQTTPEVWLENAAQFTLAPPSLTP